MKTTTFITTFNETGYNLYGRAWIKTFLERTAGSEVKARIYCEQFVPDTVDSERVEFVDFYKEIPHHANWKSQYLATTAHLKYTKNMTVRFSYKAFVIQHALEKIDTDYVIWLDGDCVFVGNQYDTFAEEVLCEKFLACQIETNGRSGVHHVESGVLIFNSAHADKILYREKFKEFYRVENINLMPNDCYDTAYGTDKTWEEYGPYDGFITHKTIATTGIEVVDLNVNEHVNNFVGFPEDTFGHPALRKRFVHNIGHAGKNNYPELNNELNIETDIKFWNHECTDLMNDLTVTQVDGYNIMLANAVFENKTFDFYTHNPIFDAVISKHIHQHGSWEPNISKIIVDAMKPGGIFVDIGANIGWHTRVAQEYGFDTISFEPDEKNYNILEKNCLRGNLHHLGLGETSGTYRMSTALGNFGNSFITDDGENEIRVERLDDIIDLKTAKKVNVVKMDVQGFEVKVMKGGTKFFEALQPGTVLIIEINPNALGNEINYLITLLSSCQSSYAICFWGDDGRSTIMPVSSAIRTCLKPNEKLLQIYGRKEILEFDMVVTL